MSVLSAEAPLASLPQGTFLNYMPRFISATPEAVWELRFDPMMPLAQNGAALQVILSWLYVRWPLCGKDVWDALLVRGEKGSCRRGRGTGDKEVLLQAGSNSTGGEVSLHSE